MNDAAPVGATAISDLGQGVEVLTYRGYSVEQLAEVATFEEVAYLLLRGRLPNRDELHAYTQRLRDMRPLPRALISMLEHIPPRGPMGAMDALRTACSFLGSLEPEETARDSFDAADRLLARMPGIMVYWYRYVTKGFRFVVESDELTTAGHILALLGDQPPNELHRRTLDASLILYADLAYNASTFACRVCASTMSDYHSCITAGVAALRGPLHGGASIAVMELLDRFPDADAARSGVGLMIKNRGRVPGFGHALFRRDPRAPLLKNRARVLAEGTPLFQVAEAIEELMAQEKGLAPNVDFYTACCYRSMNIPTVLFAPLFVCARLAGWSAHIAEQRMSNKLIHPTAHYIGPGPRLVPPLDARDLNESV